MEKRKTIILAAIVVAIFVTSLSMGCVDQQKKEEAKTKLSETKEEIGAAAKNVTESKESKELAATLNETEEVLNATLNEIEDILNATLIETEEVLNATLNEIEEILNATLIETE